MSGGILQLVAYGAQDLYLTGQPQITFFKSVYRRTTMFSSESIQQQFNGTASLGSRITSTISRNGDLLSKLWVTANVQVSPALVYQNGNNSTSYVAVRSGTSLVKGVGYGLLKKVELEIGGQVIDRQYSDWLEIWTELTTPACKVTALNRLTGVTTSTGVQTNIRVGVIPFNGTLTIANGTTTSAAVNALISASPASASLSSELYVPLQFWFCRNVGLALPLIALQYHEVKINIELASLSEITVIDNETTINSFTGLSVVGVADLSAANVALASPATGTLADISIAPSVSPISNVSLWADYIYLDVDERKRFAQVSHEYLIDQLQFVGASSVQQNATRHTSSLSFNHPVKELIWVFKSNVNAEKVGMWLSESQAPLSGVQLKLNGHDRFNSRPGVYFSQVQPYQHHTAVPPIGSGVYMYSFALKPEEHQPSGTCNFSRIDNAQLNFTGSFPASASICKVFATNYNILRVISGMGGVAYSN